MSRYIIPWLLCMLLSVGCAQNKRNSPLEVTYIANEGFMISMGETKVLIDPLPKSKHYANPSESLSTRIIEGVSPFEKIDYVFVTHDHADHFNAEMMAEYLQHHPESQFVSNKEVCDKLTGINTTTVQQSKIDLKIGEQRTIVFDKARIMVMRLEHGGDPDFTNLAYYIQGNGYSIFHTGDARLSSNEQYLRTIDWKANKVDLLFIEYFDQSSETQDIIETLIKPNHVILMHIAPGEEDSIRNVNQKIHPRTVVFGKENETRRFTED